MRTGGVGAARLTSRGPLKIDVTESTTPKYTAAYAAPPNSKSPTSTCRATGFLPCKGGAAAIAACRLEEGSSYPIISFRSRPLPAVFFAQNKQEPQNGAPYKTTTVST